MVEAIGRSLAWLLLLIGGVVLIAARDPTSPNATVEAVGQLGIALGSAGLGAELGRSQADRLIRARLIPPFQSSVRAGRGIVRLANEVAYARTELAARAAASIPTKDAEAHLRAIAIRIDEQGADRVKSLDDWRGLLPKEVQELESSAREASS